MEASSTCAPHTHSLQSANRQAARKLKFESKNTHTLKVSVVLRLNAEAGRDTILESSEKRWGSAILKCSTLE